MKPTTETIDYFLRSFRISNSNREVPALRDGVIQLEPTSAGVKLEMANEDFYDLIKFALKGRDNK